MLKIRKSKLLYHHKAQKVTEILVILDQHLETGLFLLELKLQGQIRKIFPRISF